MIGTSTFFKGALLEYRAQNRWLILLIVILMGSLNARFFQLQVLGGKKYEKLAEINQVKRSRIPPRRGEILDRNGRALAINIDLYAATIIPHYIEDIDDTLSRLQGLLRLTDDQVDTARTRYYEFLDDKKKRFIIKRERIYFGCKDDGLRKYQNILCSYFT